MRFWEDQDGSMTSYSILAGLISIAVIFSVANSGDQVRKIFQGADDSLLLKVIKEQSCVVENGRGLQVPDETGNAWGECLASSCEQGFHVEGGSCELNSKTASIANGVAYQEWNSEWETVAVDCDAGFHEEARSCVSNTRAVPIENGVRVDQWDGSSWASSEYVCNSGYVEEGGACVTPTSGTWVQIAENIRSSGGSPYSSYTKRFVTAGSTCSIIGENVWWEEFGGGFAFSWLFECQL